MYKCGQNCSICKEPDSVVERTVIIGILGLVAIACSYTGQVLAYFFPLF